MLSSPPGHPNPGSSERGDPNPTPAVVVDLNADVGELEGPGHPGDGALLGLVTTVHVACGFHAGGPDLMRRTVTAAVAAGVAVGAHPSYPDREGFGRRPMDRLPERVAEDVLYQVGALDGIARACGTTVRSVKPHGALYSRMAVDEGCARAVVVAVRDYGGDLVLVVPAGSVALRVAREVGVPAAAEGFCDRAYLADGTLAPRSASDSLIVDPEEAARRAVSLAVDHRVTALDDTVLSLDCDTLCVHGDTPGAAIIATAVRRALEEAGLVVAPFAGLAG